MTNKPTQIKLGLFRIKFAIKSKHMHKILNVLFSKIFRFVNFAFSLSNIQDVQWNSDSKAKKEKIQKKKVWVILNLNNIITNVQIWMPSIN